MKKTLALLLVAGSTLSLSACNGIPKCNDLLDECDRGGPYTEERTIGTTKRTVAKPAPAPVKAPVAVVAPTPAPIYEPAPVVDTQIMRSAEPEFKQISK